MRKLITGILLLVLATFAAGAFAQLATVNAAIGANLVVTFINGTPALAPATGVPDVETGIRNVQAALNAAGVFPQVITTNAFAATITWGHETSASNVGNDEIVVATGADGAGGGADADATNNGLAGSAYAIGGRGSAGNADGGGALATVTTEDGVARAFGGSASGTGTGGSSIARAFAAPISGTAVGSAIAKGGDAIDGIGGTALAEAEGDAEAIGGNGDPNSGTSVGGEAIVARTFNGSNVGATATAIGGSANTGGTATEADGPTTGSLGPVGPTGGSGGTVTAQ